MFELRAIAFLDILGFTSLVVEAEKQAATFARLVGLRTVIDAHVQFDNRAVAASVPIRAKPQYHFISDSIVLSAPLDVPDYDGLAIVVAKTNEIAHKVLTMGFLLRGCINVGMVWHDTTNIFGTGYMRAYLEERRAKHPWIPLTDTAEAYFNTHDMRSIPLTEMALCRRYKGRLAADTLHPSYSRDLTPAFKGNLETLYESYVTQIVGNRDKLPWCHKGRKHWNWMAKYFNSYMEERDLLARVR